jgi:hypothetical protein
MTKQISICIREDDYESTKKLGFRYAHVFHLGCEAASFQLEKKSLHETIESLKAEILQRERAIMTLQEKLIKTQDKLENKRLVAN